MSDFNRYMTKEAQFQGLYNVGKDVVSGLSKTLAVAAESAHTLLPLVVLAPAIAGSTAAIAHSKLTSPSEDESDISTAQDESMARMYEMEATKRRRELLQKIKQSSLR